MTPWGAAYVTIFRPLVCAASVMPPPLVRFVNPTAFMAVMAWPARFPEWQ